MRHHMVTLQSRIISFSFTCSDANELSSNSCKSLVQKISKSNGKSEGIALAFITFHQKIKKLKNREKIMILDSYRKVGLVSLEILVL
jgi:hypothetical protein